MTKAFSYSNAEFDEYAAEYDVALARGLAISGEHKDYFARRRIEWLANCLKHFNERPRKIMDFGCGIGSTTSFLRNFLGYESLIGVDTSFQSLSVARLKYGSEDTQFEAFNDYRPVEDRDLVFCNGVFHHIPVAERAAGLDYVYRSLRPSGLFCVWENNPWNPGTRYVMSRIPFDRDAIPVAPHQMARLLEASGFQVLSRDFLFIFPRALRWFRWIEPHVNRLPLGAQYQYLCRKNQTKDSVLEGSQVD